MQMRRGFSYILQNEKFSFVGGWIDCLLFSKNVDAHPFSHVLSRLSYSILSHACGPCFVNICVKLPLDLRSKPKGINSSCAEWEWVNSGHTEDINSGRTDNALWLGNQVKKSFLCIKAFCLRVEMLSCRILLTQWTAPHRRN